MPLHVPPHVRRGKHELTQIIFDNNFIEFVRNHDYTQGPIIFIPTHKSYMDFMILSYLLVMRDARPPLIGAADNMNNILIISKLFQLSGAFYIKRTGQKYPRVYRAILNEYLKSVLENEMNIEFFMEATRSRNGQILYPKFGFLKYVVEAYLEKRIPNAILIPLNITYENLIEADSYIVEHRGGQKVQEDTWRVIKATRLIYQNFGKVIINSAEPISLKKYIEWDSSAGENLLPNREDEFVESLGLFLADVLQDKSVFMHTHIVCAILLMRQHYQLVKDLETSVRMFSHQIKQRGGKVFEMDEAEFNFDSAIKCFKERLSIRGDTFNERRVCIDRAEYIENCFALKYYSNSMNYLFFTEALIFFAASHQHALERTLKLGELWKKVQLLQELFKREIFLPESHRLHSKDNMVQFILSRKLPFLKIISEEEGELVQELQREDLLIVEFYNTLLPPIFAGYMVALISLVALKTSEPTETEGWTHTSQRLAETTYRTGVVQSPTLSSIFYTKNVFQYLLERGIINEKPILRGDKLRKCFWVEDRPALKLLLKKLRSDFLWEENYRIIRRVFEQKVLSEKGKETTAPRQKL